MANSLSDSAVVSGRKCKQAAYNYSMMNGMYEWTHVCLYIYCTPIYKSIRTTVKSSMNVSKFTHIIYQYKILTKTENNKQMTRVDVKLYHSTDIQYYEVTKRLAFPPPRSLAIALSHDTNHMSPITWLHRLWSVMWHLLHHLLHNTLQLHRDCNHAKHKKNYINKLLFKNHYTDFTTFLFNILAWVVFTYLIQVEIFIQDHK